MDLSELPSGNIPRRHPWEVARFEFFSKVLAQASLPRTDSRLLDVGAGDGWFSQQLLHNRPCGPIVSWDAFYTDDQLLALAATLTGVHFTRIQPLERFDLVLLLDVLEHVEDDRGFLERVVAQNVTSGGHVLVSVPAWPVLFSTHDVALRHHRRYTPGQGRRLVDSCGLELLSSGGLFHSLLLPRLAQRLLQSLHRSGKVTGGGIGEWHAGPGVTSVVHGALSMDTAVSFLSSKVRLSLPGLSWWALCRRPS